MSKKIAFFFFLFAFQLLKSQPANTNLSNGILFDGEPFIAINPVNKQNIAAAWMGMKFSGGGFHIAIKTRASFDGGNSWSSVNTLPHFGNDFGSADESMAFDKNGLLYISYIDYKQAPDSGGIYVARSPDGGLTWDEPTKAFDMYDHPSKRPIDRPWLVVDKSNTANSGTLYITTKPAPWIAPPNRNYFKVSSDSGYTWTAIANVDGGTFLIGNQIAQPMAAPATTLNGKFCAAYPGYVASQNPLPAYYLATSSNKGQSFSYSTVFAALPVAVDTNFKSGYLLIANPIDSNKMIFILPNASNGDADIMALHSNDGGQNWSGLIRVNDDGLSNGKGQDLVWAAYNEQGNLAITWRDRRNATADGFWNSDYDFYYTISYDNGQTFLPNQKLSVQLIAFDSLIALNGNDFMSCAFSNDTLYSVWGDTRNGSMNIYFAKTIASTNTNIGIVLLNGDEHEWNLFPNPAKGNMQVNISENMIGKWIFVYDANGKIIFQEIASGRSININIENSGSHLYFVKIGNDVKRFVME